MERWSFVFTCSVYFNILIVFVSGLTMHDCIEGWIDVPEDTSAFITCSNISKTENVTWTVENDIRNETILNTVCESIASCNRINTNETSLQSYRDDGISLVINRNHRRYGGFTVTCSTTTEHAECRMNVFHAAELSHCKTEINTRSWRVTAICNINNFFSSKENARCEGRVEPFILEQSVNKYSRFDKPLFLQNYTDPRNNNIYQKGTCSFSSDLPTSAGNYSYIIFITPGTAHETAGKVLIDKSETNCTTFLPDNPSDSCECFKRDVGSLVTTPQSNAGATASYVCNILMASQSNSGPPSHNITSQTPQTPGDPATDCPTYVHEGWDLKCKCFATQPTDPTDTISWNVLGGGSLLNVKNISRQQDGIKYTCHLDWGTGTSRSRKSVTYTIHVAIGPNSVKISTNTTQPFVTDGTAHMALICEAIDVYPAANYTWTGVTCINEHHQHGTCIFTPRVPQDDGRQVSCTAYNVVSLDQKTSQPYTIQLNYPPPSTPNITGDKEGWVLTEGEKITLNCTVHGGKPKVTSVTFFCGDEPDSPDVSGDEFVTSSVVINVQTKHNNTLCKCSATWTQQQMYRDTNFIRLFVRGLGSSSTDKIDSSSSPQDEVGQSVPIGVIAGVVVAVVATIIAIAIIVYVTRRQQNQSTTRTTSFKDNPQHDDFQEQVNEFYISADSLALNRIRPVDGLPQSRVQDPVAQLSPHKGSDFTDKGCTTQRASNSSPSLSAHEQQATQPCLKELEKNCESTMSNTENYYAVVSDKDLCGSKP